MKPETVTLKVSNGHLIKIIKGYKPFGYKYVGIYTKKIKTEDKNAISKNRT